MSQWFQPLEKFVNLYVFFDKIQIVSIKSVKSITGTLISCVGQVYISPWQDKFQKYNFRYVWYYFFYLLTPFFQRWKEICVNIMFPSPHVLRVRQSSELHLYINGRLYTNLKGTWHIYVIGTCITFLKFSTNYFFYNGATKVLSWGLTGDLCGITHFQGWDLNFLLQTCTVHKSIPTLQQIFPDTTPGSLWFFIWTYIRKYISTCCFCLL